MCSVADTKLLVQKGLYEEWPGLQRIVRMERGRLCDDLRSKETVYYLSSEEKDDEMYTRPLGD
ncbi:MAG: hypothetical protein HDR88_16625 [Bacteroides sp.]|nr:hypothetical protein [Bacteroides sp.]